MLDPVHFSVQNTSTEQAFSLDSAFKSMEGLVDPPAAAPLALDDQETVFPEAVLSAGDARDPVLSNTTIGISSAYEVTRIVRRSPDSWSANRPLVELAARKACWVIRGTRSDRRG